MLYISFNADFSLDHFRSGQLGYKDYVRLKVRHMIESNRLKICSLCEASHNVLRIMVLADTFVRFSQYICH